MAYYITGDCHVNFDKLIYFSRFNRKLTENDVIILLGDVGLNYFGKEKDNVNKQILADFPNYFYVFMEIMKKDHLIFQAIE